TNLDLSKLDPRKVELPEFDMPTFDFPKFEMPEIDLPKFDMPEIDVPAEVDRVADFVRDVTYAGIGAWVIAAQKVDSEVRKLATKAA
ncbi:MAG: hypothetical protein RLN74_00505, partial [Ilumatobacter fluminis]